MRRPPTLIASTSVRKYVLDLLKEDVDRREKHAGIALADLPRHALVDPITQRTRLATVTRLRNEATRARQILDYFREHFDSSA